MIQPTKRHVARMYPIATGGFMNDTGSNNEAPRAAGAVELLARDDVERKRFLKMAGKRMGAGAAATSLAAFVAACGSSSSSSS
ncbi:MAG: hypothetical protein ABI355_08280, partial [Solirubrobacteraceae bacterium]